MAVILLRFEHGKLAVRWPLSWQVAARDSPKSAHIAFYLLLEEALPYHRGILADLVALPAIPKLLLAPALCAFLQSSPLTAVLKESWVFSEIVLSVPLVYCKDRRHPVARASLFTRGHMLIAHTFS